MVMAPDRPLEETITSNEIKKIEIQKYSSSRSGASVWKSLLLAELRHVNKSRLKMELRVSLLNVLEK